MVQLMWFFSFINNIITRPGRGKQVFVGVSGGVDSSVSALLLKLYGYTVTGVFIRTWQPDWIVCTWREERRDAMRVCAHLGIPFLELDLSDQYKKGVADYMIAEYRAGRTPNPDVMCNREVKFGGFLPWAIQKGATYIATGHYAQNSNDQLLKGVDPAKDQSYFLWTLTQQQLSSVLFPVGGFPKKVTRRLARWFMIPTAQKKDSQGICFIGEIDMKDFLRQYIQESPGEVVDESGKIIGGHHGVLFYTLGERHGFSLIHQGTHTKPYYVIGKDLERNQLIVSQTIHPRLQSRRVVLSECVWRQLLEQKLYTAQIRYHGTFQSCSISFHDGEYSIELDIDDPTLAPGQSVVIYDKEVCIGGGIVAG